MASMKSGWYVLEATNCATSLIVELKWKAALCHIIYLFKIFISSFLTTLTTKISCVCYIQTVAISSSTRISIICNHNVLFFPIP